MEKTATITDLEIVTREWLIGSPHSEIDSEEIESHLGDSEWRISSDTESVVALSADDDGDLVGIRYERLERPRRWVTEVVGLKTADGFYVSVRVSSDSDSPGDMIRDAKKPYVIKLIINKLGGGVDGGLKVGDKPHLLKPEEIDRAHDILTGTTKCILPIVYVSAYADGEHAANYREMAKWLSGVAHVVVEPTREFSFALRDKVSGRNAYDGAIAVHWPLATSRDLILPSRYRHESRDIELAVTRKVRDGLNAFRLPSRCTWANLQQIQSRRAIAKLRESGSSAIDDYITEFDQELESKSSIIGQLESENARLRSSLIEAEKVQRSSSSSALIEKGRESEFYPGEYRELLISLLKDAVNNQGPGSRRAHLLADLLDANPLAGVIEDRKKRLKAALENNEGLDKKTRRSLEELGFTISSDGKHHKLTYFDDQRYGFSQSKTSSDHRAGKNLVSEISGRVF